MVALITTEYWGIRLVRIQLVRIQLVRIQLVRIQLVRIRIRLVIGGCGRYIPGKHGLFWRISAVLSTRTLTYVSS